MTRFCTIFFLFISTTAFAALQVHPTRIFLGKADRSAQVALRHQGEVKTKYRMSTVFYKMDPSGGLKPVENPLIPKISAARHVRFTPRQVELTPGIEQIVRILFRPKENLKEGDYLSYIRFEEIGAVEKGQVNPASQRSVMELKARLAISVPIIVRIGKPSIQLTLENLKIFKKQGKTYFKADMKKIGNRFALGMVKLFAENSRGKRKEVQLVKGISSYIAKRSIQYPIDEQKLSALHSANKLVLEFYEDSDNGDIKIAETSVKI